MQPINWNNLGLKGESKQKSFEDICMFLCCRKLKISKINSYQNQPGIETEPFEVNGKKYGFQAKFFDSKFDWKQVKDSVIKGIKLYPELDKIFVYSNRDRTLSKTEPTKAEKEIEKEAKDKNINIEYVANKDLLLKLSQPANLDLAQLYFSSSDELGFIKNSLNPKLLTFIQSSEYLELPCVDEKENSQIINISGKILENKDENIFLLTGHPGSGKSVLMHKLLEVFGGLDKNTENEMIEVLTNNNAVPVLINLKNCITNSLENIVRERKNDSKVNGQDLGFIYLFDGLDELDEGVADNALFQIHELSQKFNTKKIIISCRSGNLNKIKAKSYFHDIVEYQIADLKVNYLDNYFEVKGDKLKQKNLKTFKKVNSVIIDEIKDILLIKLLWDTIEELDESSTILDLFSKKIDLLLESPKHSKNIENLNLLNCKKEEILNLNQDISFEFQKKFQFRFPQQDLQKLILDKFPRLDYKSINSIINYIADLFFDNSYKPLDGSNSSFIYQHRRYQEYFFTKKLKSEYEKNPQIIRELKLLSNREYFEKLFLPYLRKEYEKENNLPGMVELNLIDVYLGKHKGFGVDEAYYMNSSEFIPALASQDKNIFNELLESENLQIKDKISIDFQELESQFKKWNKDKNNFRANDYLKDIWQISIASLIENIVLLWKSGNKDVANNFRIQLQSTTNLYDKHKFHENLKEDYRLDDPFWNQFENWVYYRLVIKNETVEDIFNDLIKKSYQGFSDDNNWHYEERGKEKLVKSFFRICLKEKRNDFYGLISNFDEYEFLALLEIFKSIEYLPIFAQSKSIHEQIKSFVESYPEENITIIFYKKYFNINISKKEIEVAKTALEELREKRPVDWSWDKTHVKFAIASYILGKFSFEKYLQQQEQKGYHFRYYDELGLYSSLFKDFISLLKEEKEIESIVRDYIRYINFYYEDNYYGKYLKFNISFFWADIFSLEDNNQKLLRLKKILVKDENNIIPFSFFLQFNRLVPNRFFRIINESDLISIEKQLSNWDDDFPSYIDRCFNLSIFFSKIDNQKSVSYFEKGIIDGILRHGWRKDHIVSYSLVDALEVLWRNNWESKEKLEKYSKMVFDLTLRVSNITDGKATWQGPYNIVRLIANYDIDLAEEFKKQIIESEGYSSFSNQVITSILKAKVKNGVEIEEIEKGMSEFRKDYGHEGKPWSDYYEQKFIVYLNIAESNLYSIKENKIAFDKAYSQVEELRQHKIDYYLNDSSFKNEKLRFQQLCDKHSKEFNLTFNEKNSNEKPFVKKQKITLEKQFIGKVGKCHTSRQIAGKYKQLDNYDNGIILSSYESWEVLIQKTLEINQNLKLLFDYLMKNNFPHTDFWTSNSKYFHLPIAIALKDINTRQEVLNYLFKNSGHEGFKNIMKSYEVINDKNMCLSLFSRYLKFCRLIVD